MIPYFKYLEDCYNMAFSECSTIYKNQGLQEPNSQALPLHTQCHISGETAHTLDITDLHIYHGSSLGDAGNASCSNIISILEQDMQCLFLMSLKTIWATGPCSWVTLNHSETKVPKSFQLRTMDLNIMGGSSLFLLVKLYFVHEKAHQPTDQVASKLCV